MRISAQTTPTPHNRALWHVTSQETGAQNREPPMLCSTLSNTTFSIPAPPHPNSPLAVRHVIGLWPALLFILCKVQ